MNLDIVHIRPRSNGLPTLVFLHEGLGSLGLWRDFPERLAQGTGYGAIIYSRLGYGRSPKAEVPRPADYMHHEACHVLPEVLTHCNVASRDTVLVGHSDGATIALIFAGSLSQKDQPRRLIVESPHLFVEPRSMDGVRAAKLAYESGNLRAKMEKHHDDVDATFYGWNNVWLGAAFSTMTIEADCARIHVPVLAIQGREDAYGTMQQLDALARLVRGRFVRCELDGCGHAPHHEKPDETLAIMLAFLE